MSEITLTDRLRHEASMNPDRDEYRHEVLGRAADALAAKDAEIERLREEVHLLANRRGGECDTCGGWVCPPLRCAACMMTNRLTPDSDPRPLAAEAIRKQDAEIAALREAVRVLGDWCAADMRMSEITAQPKPRLGVMETAMNKYSEAKAKALANPLARAAVEGKG